MTYWAVSLDYSADLGDADDELIEHFTEMDTELDGAAVGQSDRALSVVLGVHAGSVAEAFELGADLVQAAAERHGIEPGELTEVGIKTHARLEAELDEPNYPDLVSSAEAAEILGVTRQRVHQLHRDHPEFPTPLYELRTGPLWVRAGIEGFGRRWTRKPGRPSKVSA
jgi:hypothetical protein